MKKKYIKEIINLMSQHDLNKIKIKNKYSSITIIKNINKKKNIKITNSIKSPLVGIFYSSPTPEKPPFIKIGDTVKKGDVICIIEIMKTLHQIKADKSGKIIEILVKNEELVEYNQELFIIENV